MNNKILFIIPTLSNGGAERVVSNVANSLSTTYDVTILCFYKTSTTYLINENVRVIYMFDSSVSVLKKIATIRRKIKEINPSMIFPFLKYVCIYATLSTLFTKYQKKIYCTLRVNPKKSKLLWLYKICIRLTNKLIVQNEGEKSFFSKKTQKKTIIIPNPISKEVYDIEKKYNDRLKTICCVGRLTEQKNFEQIIRVFSKLNSKYKFELYIYGQGTKENELKQLAESLGLKKEIIFCGYCKNVIKEVSNHDLFVLTSKKEGMPNSLMEAMAVGVPVISANCEYGPADLIEDGIDGFLYNMSDEDLLIKIKEVVNNYEQAKVMAKKGKEKITNNYNDTNITEKWKEFIKGELNNEK